jgi:hypothetical protein
MNKLKILLVPLLLVLSSAKAAPTESEFYSDSGILTIPSVKVGDIYVYDAQLRLNNAGSFDLVGYSLSPSNGVFGHDANLWCRFLCWAFIIHCTREY